MSQQTAENTTENTAPLGRAWVLAIIPLLLLGLMLAYLAMTGGGLPGNVIRVLPDGCRAVIDRTTWQPPPVFAAIAGSGGVTETEMFRTFNMGIGFTVVVAAAHSAATVAHLEAAGHPATIIGHIEAGDRSVRLD